MRVSRNLAKFGGEAHKMSGMEGGENWSKLCSLGRASFNIGSMKGEM